MRLIINFFHLFLTIQYVLDICFMFMPDERSKRSLPSCQPDGEESSRRSIAVYRRRQRERLETQR